MSSLSRKHNNVFTARKSCMSNHHSSFGGLVAQWYRSRPFHRKVAGSNPCLCKLVSCTPPRFVYKLLYQIWAVLCATGSYNPGKRHRTRSSKTSSLGPCTQPETGSPCTKRCLGTWSADRHPSLRHGPAEVIGGG